MKKIYEGSYICQTCGEEWFFSDEEGLTKAEIKKYFNECCLCKDSLWRMFKEVLSNEGIVEAVRVCSKRISKKGLR